MNYSEFRKEMKVFPNFTTREIEKHFPGFDSRLALPRGGLSLNWRSGWEFHRRKYVQRCLSLVFPNPPD